MPISRPGSARLAAREGVICGWSGKRIRRLRLVFRDIERPPSQLFWRRGWLWVGVCRLCCLFDRVEFCVYGVDVRLGGAIGESSPVRFDLNKLEGT